MRKLGNIQNENQINELFLIAKHLDKPEVFGNTINNPIEEAGHFRE